MTKMFPCEPVDVSFIETAPYRFTNSVDLAITPEQLFEVLADAESWPRWANVITKVAWTSPEPRGVGTTRVVDMRGGIVGDEEFLIWEPLRRMAFRFNECSTTAVAAFAEDYPFLQLCRTASSISSAKYIGTYASATQVRRLGQVHAAQGPAKCGIRRQSTCERQLGQPRGRPNRSVRS